MPIGPVHWGSYPGELIEQVGALLLLQERPRAWHRKPSQGDGGVDVVEPVAGGYHVYQIKKFVDALNSSDRQKIEHSLSAVKTDPRLDLPVVRWSLMIPCDQTSKNENWFRDLTEDAGFECDWLGETFWHSEAAKYPYVIDYYLENGRERLESRVRTLAGLLRDSSIPVRPADVAQSIGELHRQLNESDPHYRYDIQVTGSPPVQRTVLNLVMTQTRQIATGTFVTVDVSYRYKQALLDRPIIGSLTFRIHDIEAGIDLRDAHQAHIDYGRPLDIPAHAVSQIALDAPGGLADGLSEWSTVQVRIGPGTLIEPEPLWIDATVFEGQNEQALANALLSVSEQYIGERAIELKAHDSSGVLDCEFRIFTAQAGNRTFEYQTQISNLSSRPIRAIYQPYRFALTLHSPNKLSPIVRTSFGTLIEGTAIIGEPTLANWEASLAYIEVLWELQRYTSVPLIFSDVLSNDDWIDLCVAKDLLSGQTVRSNWTQGTFTLPNASWDQVKVDLEANPTITRIEPISIPNGNSRVILGLSRQVFSNVMLASTEQLDNKHVKITIQAGNNSCVTETLFNPETQSITS